MKHRQLADLIDIQSGFAFKSKEYSQQGHFLVRIRNVQDGYLSLDSPKYVALDGRTQKFALNEGDFLISLTGNIGRVARVEEGHLPAALNQRVARLKVRDASALSADYLFYFLSTDLFREGLSGRGHGAAQQNVSPSAIHGILIPLPPLPEQRRIVGILDEAFEGIATAKANAEKNLQNARALFESHLNAVFTQRDDGWVEKNLGELAEFKNGLNYTKSSSGQNVPVVGVGDFQSSYVVPIGNLQSATIDGKLADDYAIQRNDILTVRSNGSKALVGRCMLVPDVNEIISFSGFIIRIRFDTAKIAPRFLLHYMKSRRIRHRLTSDGGGANISNINQRKLSLLPVPVPPISKQEAIAHAVDELSSETQYLEFIYRRKLAALDDLKKSLLHRAFSGQL